MADTFLDPSVSVAFQLPGTWSLLTTLAMVMKI